MVLKRSEAKPRQTVAEIIARLEREANDPILVAARLQELRDRVAAYERQFGLPSSEIHAAIDRGDLIETWEVCGWIMDYESLLRAESRRTRTSPSAAP
jgi:hypothetical protein